MKALKNNEKDYYVGMFYPNNNDKENMGYVFVEFIPVDKYKLNILFIFSLKVPIQWNFKNVKGIYLSNEFNIYELGNMYEYIRQFGKLELDHYLEGSIKLCAEHIICGDKK